MSTSLDPILSVLKSHFQFHTAILYGSRATECFDDASDFDFLLIKQEGTRVRELIFSEDQCLDVIVENEDRINDPKDYLYLHQSILLLDEKGMGRQLISRVQEILNSHPPAMRKERIEQRRKQCADFLRYSSKETALGNYRRHWLLTNLLPLWFDLHQKWFLGDKHAFKWLQQNSPELYLLFEKALDPAAPISQIAPLVDQIFQDTLSQHKVVSS